MHEQPLPWITAARWTLIITGVFYVLFGIALGPTPLMRMILESDGKEIPDSLFYGIGAVVLVLCGGIGVANFVAAWGLKNRRKWAWVLTVIFGGLYAPSGCLPFGVILLVATLREDARIAFGITRPPAVAPPA